MKTMVERQGTQDSGSGTEGRRRAAVCVALAKACGGPADHEPRATGHAAHGCAACCADCVFAVSLEDGERRLLVCTGCPMCPGRMKITQEGGCCRAFQKRKRVSGRTVPPEPPDESVRYIPLTRGKFAIIDAADYERVAQYKWCAGSSRVKAYACRCVRGKMVLLHRFLTNAPTGMDVDHIDGNGLNNRRDNLRVCTHRQNSYNSRPKGKTSRFKGVWRDKRRGLWEVSVRLGRRNIHVGRFHDEIEAARAYDRKAYECFGEYAYLNFPDEVKS